MSLIIRWFSNPDRPITKEFIAELSTTKEFVQELSSDMGIPIDLLIFKIMKGENEIRGTWIHPDLAVHLVMWLSPKFAVKVARWVNEEIS